LPNGWPFEDRRDKNIPEREKIMKQNKKRGFITGLISGVLVSSLTVGVLASGGLQQINALVGGINIYVDGILQNPKNANGETVQPLVWEGTTYLPVRALTNMLTDKEVNWDQENMSVYIGRKPNLSAIPLHELKMYEHYYVNTNEAKEGSPKKYDRISNGFPMYTGNTAAFDVLNQTYTPMNRLLIGYDYNTYHYVYASRSKYDYIHEESRTEFGTDAYGVYVLDSQYKSLSGKFIIPYTEVGTVAGCGIGFYSVDQYGEETLISHTYTRTGDPPVDININLKGVEILKIVCYKDVYDWPYEFSETLPGAFYDVMLEWL